MLKKHAKDQSALGKFTLILFAVVAIVFFVSQHELRFSLGGAASFNPSAEEQITGVEQGSGNRRVGFLSLGLLGALALARKSQGRLRINGWLGALLVFYIGWAASSILWADDAVFTLRRIVVFGAVCLGALGAAKMCSFRGVVLLTWFTSGLYLLIGTVVELLLGTLRPFAQGYRFAGTLHPNHQGINCALLVLSAIAAANIMPRIRPLAVVCGTVGILFLVLTGSRTALTSAAMAMAVFWGLVSSRSAKRFIAVFVLTVVCGLASITASYVSSLVQQSILVNRPDSVVMSLDGRVPVWEESWSYAHRHLVTGIGYGGFWNARRIADTSAQQGWGVAEGHSAYLDLILNIGLVGALTYAGLLFIGIKRSTILYRLSLKREYAFCAAMLLFGGLDGVLESAIIDGTLLSFLSMTVLFKLGFQSVRGGTGASVRVRGVSQDPRLSAQ